MGFSALVQNSCDFIWTCFNIFSLFLPLHIHHEVHQWRYSFLSFTFYSGYDSRACVLGPLLFDSMSLMMTDAKWHFPSMTVT
jgi:hypothetical protein